MTTGAPYFKIAGGSKELLSQTYPYQALITVNVGRSIMFPPPPKVTQYFLNLECFVLWEHYTLSIVFRLAKG